MKATRVKPVSRLRRYEYLQRVGVTLGGLHSLEGQMNGKQLDDYVDEQIWRETHPGQEPEVDFGEQP